MARSVVRPACVCRTFAQLTERTDAQLKNFGEFVLIVLQFIGISLASVLVGVLLGLAASAVRAVDCCRLFHSMHTLCCISLANPPTL